MASILKVDDLRGNTAAGNITITSENGAATMQLQQGLTKAWLRGTTSAGIGDSLNISSGTDHGTGDLSYATTNPFTSVEYANEWTVYTTAARIAIRNDSRDAPGVLAVEMFTVSTSLSDNPHNGTCDGDLA
ncbi:MAG: hypothetical protein ACPHHR_10230 [Cycloclasticus sp.]